VARLIRDLVGLQERLGHGFADIELLERALTHVTAAKGDNVRLQSYQRLEFLGDRVLGLAVADMLSAAYPQAEEGELARRMAELVRRETCADVATEWNVGPCIRLGAGEAQSGGRKRQTILADVCEAIIGACYLDGGFGPAKALVERSWSARLAAEGGDRRDSKTKLQELAQGKGLATPTYAEVSRSGPAHRMAFVIRVDAPGLGSDEGRGSSKREAEQAAARALLDRLAEAADKAE
jgi:ribonuclease-3